MSTPITIEIAGIGPVPVHGEYTAPEVAAFYGDRIKIIVDTYNSDPNTLTAADITNFKTALAELQAIAAGGLNVGGKTFYLTVEMGRSVDLIIKSLASSLYNPTATDLEILETLKAWQDLGNVGLSEILIAAGNATFSNKSLQSLIELEYVKNGNELIGTELTGLRDSLEITKQVLQALERVQDLQNLIAPGESIEQIDLILEEWSSGGAFTFNDSILGEIPTQLYNDVYNGTKSIGDLLEAGVTPMVLAIGGEPENAPLFADVTGLFERLQEIGAIPATASESSMWGAYLTPDQIRQIIPGPPSTAQNFPNGLYDLYASGPPNSQLINMSGTAAYNTATLLDGINATLAANDPDEYASPEDLTAAMQNDLDEHLNFLAAKVSTQISDGELVEQFNSAREELGRVLQLVNDAQGLEIDGTPQENTLAAKLQKVYDNMESRGDVEDIKHWIIDFQDVSDQLEAGNGQREITQAITQSQQLNDRQKEDLRRFMYLFEQYYKSAAAMLQAITRIVEKMAQGIKL